MNKRDRAAKRARELIEDKSVVELRPDELADAWLREQVRKRQLPGESYQQTFERLLTDYLELLEEED